MLPSVRRIAPVAAIFVSGVVASAIACSSEDSNPPGAPDASTDSTIADSTVETPDTGTTKDTGSDTAVADAGADVEVDSGLAPTPPTAEAITGLTLFDGWGDPRALAAPVNSLGWEDSSYISASGRKLYFGYGRLDYDSISHGVFGLAGPTRPGQSKDTFGIFEATMQDGGWNVVASTANYAGPFSEAAIGVDNAESTMVLVRFDGSANQGDVYLSKNVGGVWGASTKLPAPINTACIEDNAAISADGQRLYFDSNRADALGTTCKAATGSESRDIYMSTLQNGVWGAPVAIKGEPTKGIIHWQPYPRHDEKELYWSGFDDTCGTSQCVYRASKQPDGSYANRVIVMKAVPEAQSKPGDAYGIGEVSITEDGRFLYFVYLLRSSADGGFDGGPGTNVNVGVARKL